MFVISGQSDWVADSHNIARLLSNLPTPAKQLVVKSYAHVDLFLSDSVGKDVFEPIVEFLRETEAN
jgi:hypothetical protein